MDSAFLCFLEIWGQYRENGLLKNPRFNHGTCIYSYNAFAVIKGALAVGFGMFMYRIGPFTWVDHHILKTGKICILPLGSILRMRPYNDPDISDSWVFIISDFCYPFLYKWHF